MDVCMQMQIPGVDGYGYACMCACKYMYDDCGLYENECPFLASFMLLTCYCSFLKGCAVLSVATITLLHLT